jgi:hypothetical protein
MGMSVKSFARRQPWLEVQLPVRDPEHNMAHQTHLRIAFFSLADVQQAEHLRAGLDSSTESPLHLPVWRMEE